MWFFILNISVDYLIFYSMWFHFVFLKKEIFFELTEHVIFLFSYIKNILA